MRPRDGTALVPSELELDGETFDGFGTLKFGRVPQGPQKSEIVASRFTLQGRLRPHAGKSGPFLLHGG